ncbi:MAG: aminopeptidase P family protein, partial [Caldiserica bacterium]|nr:aminopeptidase P family protein [Caldisericota bacterium]
MRIGKLFSPLTLLRRRDKIREKVRKKKADGFLIFHQPNVFYLTGFAGEGFFLLLGEKGFLFTDYRYLPSSPSTADDWEFVPVKKDYFRSLKKKIQEEKLKKVAVETAHVSVSRWKELNRYKNVKWLPLPGCVEEARMIKDKEEIEFIKQAINISTKVLDEVPDILKIGMQERDLAVEIEYRLRKYGSEPLPFIPIVASGKNASLPHAAPDTKGIEPGEPLIVDLGAKVNGYCADLTRTFFPG